MEQNSDTEKDPHLWSINFQQNPKVIQRGIMIDQAFQLSDINYFPLLGFVLLLGNPQRERGKSTLGCSLVDAETEAK